MVVSKKRRRSRNAEDYDSVTLILLTCAGNITWKLYLNTNLRSFCKVALYYLTEIIILCETVYGVSHISEPPIKLMIRDTPLTLRMIICSERDMNASYSSIFERRFANGLMELWGAAYFSSSSMEQRTRIMSNMNGIQLVGLNLCEKLLQNFYRISRTIVEVLPWSANPSGLNCLRIFDINSFLSLSTNA